MHQEDEVTHAKPRRGSDRPRRQPSQPALALATPAPSVAEPPPSERKASLPPAPPEPDELAKTEVRTQPQVAVIVADVTGPPPAVETAPDPATTESEPPQPVRPPRPVVSDAEEGDSVPPPEIKHTPTPAEMRFSITSEDASQSDPRFTVMSSRPGASSTSVRLFAGLVIFGLLGFGAVLLVRYLTRATNPSAGGSDDRIGAYLTESDKLLKQGDVDGASDQLVKASALSDSDPKVARAQAMLANVRAEVPCLRADLLGEGDAERETAVSECASAADKAGKAVQRALSFAPADPANVRAEIDQKRLSGDVSGARKLVDRIATIDTEAQTALVLGALDLREASPPWQSVVDRLSKAAGDEGDLGRARALLVYALARSGDLKRARSELDRIIHLAHPHPLKAALTKFLDRADKGELPAARVDDLPSAAGTTQPSVGTGKPTGDAGSLLAQAHEAYARHDLSRAEKLYQTVLDHDPQNGEAVAGLAAVAREEGQLGRADALYKRSLEDNNGYIPAIVSAADLKWETGQKDAAVDLYSRLLELDPTGPDAARARSRIAERNAEAAQHPTEAPTATPTTAPSAPEPPPQGGSSSSTGLPADVPLNP